MSDFLIRGQSNNITAIEQQLSAQNLNLGEFAGQFNQGFSAIAIGKAAGQHNQGIVATAVGNQAGKHNQSSRGTALGFAAGFSGQGQEAVAVGGQAGRGSQGQNAVAIGNLSGAFEQGAGSVSVGTRAARVNQDFNSIAIGLEAGEHNQDSEAIAIGFQASRRTQGNKAISIGRQSGLTNQGSLAIAMGAGSGKDHQGVGAVAIGTNAGLGTQGDNSIAIGYYAGRTNQPAGSIALNASGTDLTVNAAGFFVNPVRTEAAGVGANVLSYNGSNEIVENSDKTFVIDHPKDESKYLVHACLEGPEAGVYYRGKAEIVNGSYIDVELPDYVDALASEFTVHLTSIWNGSPRSGVLEAGPVENGKFRVYGKAGKFTWLVHGLRSSVVVEPSKEESVLHGEGPYRWLE